MVLMDSDLGSQAAAAVAELREWVNLTGFIRAEMAGIIGPRPERSFRIRRLYGDILRHVAALERTHKAVCLCGLYTAPTDVKSPAEAKVGVIAIRSRDLNPAIGTFRELLVPKIVPWKESMKAWFDEE